MTRKWFGVTEFKYEPVSDEKRAAVGKQLASLRSKVASMERSLHNPANPLKWTVHELNMALAEIDEIESAELYVKVGA